MNGPVRYLSLVGALLVSASALAQGNPEQGKQLVMQGDGSGAPCMACHGQDGGGNNAGGFPRLAGLDENYLAKQMRDYNSGSRTSPIMQPNVDNFSDQQLQDIAAYYAAMPVPATKAPAADDALMAQGEKLALQGDWDNYIPPCSSCHGPDNGGMGDVFPGIAGQHPNYIASQLRAWQAGSRSNDPNNLMVAVAERLTDQQITAVAAWLGAQPASAAKGGK
ncbi:MULTISPECIES: c-type cytochrome [Marinobacter]|uniref:Cytochrome c4 n=1 Tax=Marinobacter profundi TaxID=2666256 RepID=A0A2G1URQ6_9GAMM|nr:MULTISPECIES: c-type cytochrome [Marinobacter]MBD3656708.1 cytochrome c4 [Marinobacter sp.]PHQ17069.1 cytochrome c4 [Marinobacter profundi]